MSPPKVTQKEKTSINIRFPDGLVDLIDLDIETGRCHSNRADWVSCAIHFYLAYRTMYNQQLLDYKDQARGGGPNQL